MEQNKFLKIIWLCGFIAFAAVSCWATAESLHLLLPSWPIAMCWIVTIGFFIIASLGSKMIVDSLNQNIYLEKRGLRLIGGIFLLIIFWIICIMPTNTHTFFYRTCIIDVVTQDLSTTKHYLQQLQRNTKIDEDIKNKKDILTSELNAKMIALVSEINNPANPGIGIHVRGILDDISKTLQIASLPVLSYKTNSPLQKKALITQYRTMIYQLGEKRKKELASNMRNSLDSVYMPLANKQIRNIETMDELVANMGALGRVDNDIVAQSDLSLKQSYATIKNYSDFIVFNSEDDKNLYLAENQVTKTSKMLSVIDVWKDFLDGKHVGRGFVFWIVISVLVDVAAFIFFDLAFRKTDD